MGMEIGWYAFVAGAVAAVGSALFPTLLVPTTAMLIVALTGLVVGAMNVSNSERPLFLLAMIGMTVISSAVKTMLPFGDIIGTIFGNLTVLAASAGIVVLLKTIYDILSD